MKVSFTGKIFLFLLFILSILIAAVIYYFSISRRLNETESLIRRTDAVLLCSQNILNGTIDLQTGSRGYVITGNERFLEPYLKAIPLVHKNITEIKQLTNSTRQQLEISKLEQLLTERELFSRQSIDIRREKGFEQAQQLVTAGLGKRITDSIRNIIANINQEQRQLLHNAKSENQMNKRNFERLFAILFGCVAIAIPLVGMVIYRYEKERRKNEAALLSHQNELEKKVHERTAELTKSYETLKKQDELLEATGALAKVGGWEIDLSDMTVYWTNEVYNIHELPQGKMPTVEEALTYYAPEARPVITQAVNDAITQGTSWDIELPFITAKGNHLWVKAIGKAETLDQKQRVFGVFQDITNRKIAEDKLKDQYSKLSEIAFLQSHQVRIPIASILGLIDLLNFENLADPSNVEILEHLKTTTLMLDKIVTDIMKNVNEIENM